MAEFQEVARQFKRLCDSRKWCDACIMNENRGVNTCYRFMMEQPMKAENVVMEWAAEHPIVTNGKKFEEVFGYGLEAVWAFNSAQFTKWMDSEYKGGQDERLD